MSDGDERSDGAVHTLPKRSIPPRARAAVAARRAVVRRAAIERAAALREGAHLLRSRSDSGNHPARGSKRTVSPPDRVRRSVSLRALALIAALALLFGGIGGLIAGSLLQRSLAPVGLDASAPVLDAPPGPDARAAATVAGPSLVTLRVSAGTRNEVASGIVLSAEGHVLTNAHVVTLDGTTDDAEVTATTSEGRVYAAERVGIDALADIAVLSLRGASGLKPASFANSDGIQLGQEAIVLGSPLGLSNTVTSGIVSTVQRSIEIDSPDPSRGSVEPASTPGGNSRIHLAVFQTDADTNPGNSGGAVVNGRGEVIGVSVAIATTLDEADENAEDQGSIGLGFAIHSNTAWRIAQELMAGSTPSHGALGASLKSTTDKPGATPVMLGAHIDAVSPNGAAARSGLRRGDVIVSLNGIPVTGAGDLIAQVRARPGGSSVHLTVVRDGQSTDVQITLDKAA